MNKLSLTLLSTGAAAFLGLAITAEATVPGSIVMTEVSSTTLTYSVDGGPTQTVTDTAPYDFQFNVPDNLVVTGINSEQYIFVGQLASEPLQCLTWLRFSSTTTLRTVAPSQLQVAPHPIPTVPTRPWPMAAHTPLIFPTNTPPRSLTSLAIALQMAVRPLGLLGLGLVGLFAFRPKNELMLWWV